MSNFNRFNLYFFGETLNLKLHMDYTKVIIAGHLTRDPEIRYSKSGSAITNLGVAVNKQWKGADGETNKKAHFFDVVFFGKRAETISNHFRKGSCIFVEGELEHATWNSEQGEKKSKVSIKGWEFKFVDKNPNPQDGISGEETPEKKEGAGSISEKDDVPF